MKIVIIGAGIIGITTAIRLLEKFPDASLTVITEEFSPNTTSDISGGYWNPNTELPEYNQQLTEKWSMCSYHRWMKEALSNNPDNIGVQVMQAYTLDSIEKSVIPFYSGQVAQFRELKPSEISSICSSDNLSTIKSGFGFATATVQIKKFIPLQMKLLESKGVKFIQKKLNKLREFAKSTECAEFDYIVNCVGLGARHFCDDLNMIPYRGQVLRVKAPWVKSCVHLIHEPTYILPQCDVVVLGGSYEMGVWDTKPNEKDLESILERCCKLMPSLRNAEIVDRQSGLRPFRKGGVRLELEILSAVGTRVAKVVHNYGHAGVGVILSWGCAEEVCELIRDDLNLKKAANL